MGQEGQAPSPYSMTAKRRLPFLQGKRRSIQDLSRAPGRRGGEEAKGPSPGREAEAGARERVTLPAAKADRLLCWKTRTRGPEEEVLSALRPRAGGHAGRAKRKTLPGRWQLSVGELESILYHLEWIISRGFPMRMLPSILTGGELQQASLRVLKDRGGSSNPCRERSIVVTGSSLLRSTESHADLLAHEGTISPRYRRGPGCDRQSVRNDQTS